MFGIEVRKPCPIESRNVNEIRRQLKPLPNLASNITLWFLKITYREKQKIQVSQILLLIPLDFIFLHEAGYNRVSDIRGNHFDNVRLQLGTLYSMEECKA